MPRTVWILGAGFSKPLGGPLLPELLTSASQARVHAAFRSQHGEYNALKSDYARLVLAIYAKHGPHAPTAEQHWGDAESFLEALDFAARGPGDGPSAVLIRSVVNDLLARQVPAFGRVRAQLKDLTFSLPEFAVSAKRLVAAECCAFVESSDPKTEKWDPYRRWARSLSAGESVVSFNYDRVVETARDAAGSGLIVDVVPGRGDDAMGDVPLFKMHGSVDWSHADGVFTKSERGDFALVCPSEHLVIASPGPTKSSITKDLEEIWRRALSRIREAEVVVFVGYRFPPSDSQARRKLVDALVGNTSKTLTLRTVLGPDTKNKDTLRLEGILRYAMASTDRTSYDRAGEAAQNARTYAVKVHGMGAEDFLDLYAAGHLNQPARY